MPIDVQGDLRPLADDLQVIGSAPRLDVGRRRPLHAFNVPPLIVHLLAHSVFAITGDAEIVKVVAVYMPEDQPKGGTLRPFHLPDVGLQSKVCECLSGPPDPVGQVVFLYQDNVFAPLVTPLHFLI